MALHIYINMYNGYPTYNHYRIFSQGIMPLMYVEDEDEGKSFNDIKNEYIEDTHNENFHCHPDASTYYCTCDSNHTHKWKYENNYFQIVKN
jgi:hypothetical protein